MLVALQQPKNISTVEKSSYDWDKYVDMCANPECSLEMQTPAALQEELLVNPAIIH